MSANITLLQPYADEVYQSELINIVEPHTINLQPDLLARQVVKFFQDNPLALDDFPREEGTYTRTVMLRHKSGFEVMAARWSKGTISPIHGHPWFNFYCVVHGCLKTDDYLMEKEEITLISSGEVQKNGVVFFVGEKGTFNNNIHKVHALEETLSIHISSDDSTKGRIFS
jgi:predicted metal-dependent enzyme (double-stranded beta helix superfamily)